MKMLRGTGLRLDAEKWGYIYMDRAPYEMLGNDLMPFGDIVRIKRVEDVLEKYWNAHRMDHTLLYLVDRVFPSPFDFFQLFGDYWEQRGWQKIGHQLEDLFSRLWSFLVSVNSGETAGIDNEVKEKLDLDVVLGLMKYDYFLNHNYKPRKIWWDYMLEKSEWSRWMKKLGDSPEVVSAEFVALGLQERELHKHAVLELMPFDMARFLETGELRKDRHTLLIMLYALGQEGNKPKPRPFMATVEAAEVRS